MLLVEQAQFIRYPSQRVLGALLCVVILGLACDASGQSAIETLKAGQSIERELGGGEVHSYQVILPSGQFAHIVIEQHSRDLVAIAFAPDGQQIAVFDGYWSGQEPISFMVKASGAYRLEVRAADKSARGRYEIKLDELRSGIADEDVMTAGRAMTEAKQLVDEGSVNSLRRSLEKYQEGILLWRAVHDHRGEARALSHSGYVYTALDENQKGLEYLSLALPLLREIGDQEGQETTLYNIGFVFSKSGEPQKALDCYTQALSLERATENRAGEARTLSNMGWAFSSLGEPQKAIEYFSQALPLRRAVNDKRGEALTLEAIGYVYASLGEKERALEFLGQAIDLLRSLMDRPTEADANFVIGNLYSSLDEYLTAIKYYDKALPVFREFGRRQQEGRTLWGMAQSYTGIGEYQKALDYYLLALQLNKSVNDRVGEASTLVGLGWVYSFSGNQPEAIERFTQAAAIWRSVANRIGESSALYGLAYAERDQGNLLEARLHAEAALGIVESLRAKIPGQDLRATYLASKENLYDFYVDLLMRLHEKHPAEGYAALALQANERARARSLLEVLAEAQTDIRHGVDPILLERERTLQQQLNVQSDRLARLLSGKHDEAQAAAAEKAIESRVLEHQEIEAQIRSSSPRYAALTQPVPLSLKEIQTQVLDENTLLLEYSLGAAKSFLWAVTPNSITSLELPKRLIIEEAARRVYELLTARSRAVPNERPEQKQIRVARADAEYPRAAAELSQMLLGPVASELGKKRLLVVSDGALQYVPFAALPAPQSRESRVGSLESKTSSKQTRDLRLETRDSRVQPRDSRLPLIVDHEIVSLPSASVLAALRKEMNGRPAATKTLAVLADPVFGLDDPRIPSARAAGAPPAKSQSPSADVLRSAEESGLTGFERLRFSRAEADAIARLAPESQRLEAVDFVANRATATSADLSRYRIVHFATHGLINSRHPELSGIVLSLVDEKGQQQDGFLRLYEIYNLKLNADLVVLSACQTALGKEIKGEGLIGLTRGFMYAGAPRVVASLWRIDDHATAELMKRFYRGMLGSQKLSAAAALRAAQLEMWKEKGWENPYFWAFTLQGEWR